MNYLKKLLNVIFILFPVLIMANPQIQYQTDFPSEEFKARWKNIFARMDKGAMAIVQGAAWKDRFRVFRQNNQFYYLCGIETPGSIIVLDNRN